MKFRFTIVLTFFAMIFTSCLEFVDKYTKLAPGYWRAELSLTQKNISPNKKGEYLPEKLGLKFDEVMEGQLPFIFEIKYTDDSTFYVEIINGEERIKVTDITYGRDRKTAKDTLLMKFPEYESYIKAICEGGIMEGEFVITSKENYRIPFSAKQGTKTRFTDLKKQPFIDVSGAWESTFDLNKDQPYKAIGLFKQKENTITGTFKTESGDFRYLEGSIQDKKIYLSCFDGAHAYLFEAKIQPDKTIQGAFRSGLSEPSIWEAKKNYNFRLRHPDSLTALKPGRNKLNFKITNPEGIVVTQNDEKFKDKVKIIQIMGTWCPNCKDESIFLTDFIKKYDPDKIAVVALAFERHKEVEKANQAVKKYKEALKIPYEILVAGSNDKKEVESKLDFIEGLKAYPTMLIVDKQNNIRKIHTGFAGPATDEFNTFKNEFGTFIELLLKE